MKRATIFLFSLVLLVGCKDDQKKVDPIVESAPAELELRLNFNGEDVSVNDTLELSANEMLRLTLFKLYLSDITLEGSSEAASTEIKEVLLFDPEVADLNNISADLPEGNFEAIQLGFGLNPTLNNSDPTSFDNNNPLASYQSMYWDWMKYRFARIEGDYMINDSVVSLSYHPGTDELYEVASIPLEAEMEVDATQAYQVIFEVDIAILLDGPGGTINLPEEATSHSVADDIHIARKLMKNLVGATTVSIIAVEE